MDIFQPKVSSISSRYDACVDRTSTLSITVIALSRFMLNLRGVYTANTNPLTGTGLPTQDQHVDFDVVSHIVGNLGAPLDVEVTASTNESADGFHDQSALVVSQSLLSAGLIQSLGSEESVDVENVLRESEQVLV